MPTEPSNEEEAAVEEVEVVLQPAIKSLSPQPYPPSLYPKKPVFLFVDPALAGEAPRVVRAPKPVRKTRTEIPRRGGIILR